MENFTSTVPYEWEYYYDYLDPVIVDESKLKYNKYSIVIIFWIVLVAFVGFLFLTLNLMSSSGSLPR
uniref:Melanocortin 2 receptor accessory protein n=1 Tax=Echeneis naucrates TaxID=173247 RepID=A0A665V0Z7_ECHNA